MSDTVERDKKLIGGICRVCGCTETAPCVMVSIVPGGINDTVCSWVDDAQTLCSNPRCVAMVELGELLAMLAIESAFAAGAE